MFLGREVRATPGDFTVLDPSGIRMRIPASAVAMSLALNGAPTPVLAFLELPLAHSLAHLSRMGAPEELETLREKPPTPSDDDLDQLRVTASFFAAAFAEEWDQDESGETADVIMIQDSTWQNGADPLGEAPWACLEATITLEGQPSDPITVAVPWTIVERVVPTSADAGSPSAPAPPPVESEEEPEVPTPSGNAPAPSTDEVSGAEGTATAVETQAAATVETPETQLSRPPWVRQPLTSGQTLPIVCIRSNAIAEYISSQLEDAVVETVGSVEEFSRRSQCGHLPLLVIATVSRTPEQDLRALARLKHDHFLRGSPIMILLERPVRSTVLLCGRLGLVNVLPAQVDTDTVWRRLAPWLRRENEG